MQYCNGSGACLTNKKPNGGLCPGGATECGVELLRRRDLLQQRLPGTCQSCDVTGHRRALASTCQHRRAGLERDVALQRHGMFCDAGVCQSGKKANGARARAASECGSNFCVDGVCCEGGCTAAVLHLRDLGQR